MSKLEASADGKWLASSWLAVRQSTDGAIALSERKEKEHFSTLSLSFFFLFFSYSSSYAYVMWWKRRNLALTLQLLTEGKSNPSCARFRSSVAWEKKEEEERRRRRVTLLEPLRHKRFLPCATLSPSFLAFFAHVGRACESTPRPTPTQLSLSHPLKSEKEREIRHSPSPFFFFFFYSETPPLRQSRSSLYATSPL